MRDAFWPLQLLTSQAFKILFRGCTLPNAFVVVDTCVLYCLLHFYCSKIPLFVVQSLENSHSKLPSPVAISFGRASFWTKTHIRESSCKICRESAVFDITDAVKTPEATAGHQKIHKRNLILIVNVRNQTCSQSIEVCFHYWHSSYRLAQQPACTTTRGALLHRA